MNLIRKHGAWAQIFSTIGCNVNCNFCYIPKINGPWRALGLDWFDLHLAWTGLTCTWPTW